ncbi:MAG: DUF58 domain-containing protein [Spirochaetes bacterium]|nr:DUF58 domain-containing protein [Spirochaetota bacterium]
MIIPTKKFLSILSLAFFISITGIYYKELYFFQFIFYLLLFIVSTIDFFTVVKKKKLRIRRVHDKYLSIGVNNQIKITIENLSERICFLLIRDEYPVNFKADNDTCSIKLNPYTYGTVVYHVKPILKGKYFFKNIFVRTRGFLGLVFRQYKIKYNTEISVYPNLIELKKFLTLVSNNREEQLGYKLRLSGGETEFDFLREYQPGDNYKKINWKATAKKRHPIIEIDKKEYNRNIIVLLDTGRMMTTKYGYLTKLDYAIDTSLILAAASLKKNDRFGVLSFSDKVNAFLPPSKSNRILTSILSTLYESVPSFTKSDYLSLYYFIKNKITKNSILFVFSELYNNIVSKDLIIILKLLARHHKVRLISFEEIEKESEGKKYQQIVRWTIQQSQLIERESIIRDLSYKGVNTIKVNAENIKTRVVNSYLSS